MIALCDQRSFYASCECVFRPDLRGHPVVVLSNNDGCIVACNEEAKAVGMKKFSPFFQQESLARTHSVAVFSSNYALYGEISERIMRTLRQQVPAIEVYSIDEAFCQLDGIPSADLKPLANRLRHSIWQQQRIPMGVSIGHTKTLAKLGQYATKKISKIDGVCVLETPAQAQWLAKRTPVDEVWGVGRRLAKHLRELGIDTAFRLMTLPEGLAKKVGHFPLVCTVRELNGERCIPFEFESKEKKSIICSRSFGQKIECVKPIEQAVSEYCARAAEKLRKQQSVCRRIAVFLRTSPFSDRQYSRSEASMLPASTSDTRKITAMAKMLLAKMYRPGYSYAKAGIELSIITPNTLIQNDLWAGDTEQSYHLMAVMDRVNAKYGRGCIAPAGQGFTKSHAMKQRMLSPRYLTDWRDLPRIRC